MGPVIRKFTSEDVEPMYALLSDPAVMRFLEKPYSKAQTEQFLTRAAFGLTPLIYAVEKDAALIGYVIFHDYDEDSMEIGWVLHPAHWGKGYASALTEQMMEEAGRRGKHLVIECAPEQSITRHIALKYGFEDMGISDGLQVFRLKR